MKKANWRQFALIGLMVIVMAGLMTFFSSMLGGMNPMAVSSLGLEIWGVMGLPFVGLLMMGQIEARQPTRLGSGRAPPMIATYPTGWAEGALSCESLCQTLPWTCLEHLRMNPSRTGRNPTVCRALRRHRFSRCELNTSQMTCVLT